MNDYKNIYLSTTNNQQNLRELSYLLFLNLMSVQGVVAKTIIRNYKNNKNNKGETKMKCNTCNDKYFIISNDENWNDEIQKCDECNYFKTDEQAKNYMESEGKR